MNIVNLWDTKLMHRDLLPSYRLTMKDQKGKLRKQPHLPLQQKEKQYLGINLPKEIKELYSEIYKDTDERNLKNDTERYTILLDWESQCCESIIPPKAIYSFNAIPTKLQMAFFNNRIRTKKYSLYGSTKDPK